MPNVYLPDSIFEQWRAAGKRAGFDMDKRGAGGEGVEFARKLLDDAEYYSRLVGSWNALVNGMQALGFRVWSGSDEEGWAYQWDSGKRVAGFGTDYEAIIAAVKSALKPRSRSARSK